MIDYNTLTGAQAAALYDYGLRVWAHENETITIRTGARRFYTSPHLKILTVIGSPASESGVWGLAWSTNHPRRPGTAVTGDPASWEGQHLIWEKLGTGLSMWVRTSLKAGVLPQLMVADKTALELLRWSARKIYMHPKSSPQAKEAARLLLTYAHLHRAKGSQCVLLATELLREHYISGGDLVDETSLGWWVDYPNTGPNSARAQTGLDDTSTGEQTPLGKAFDKMHAAEREERAMRAAALVPIMGKELTRRYQDLQSALKLLGKHPGTVLPLAQQIAKQETESISRYWERERTPATVSFTSKARDLAAWQKRAEQWEKYLWFYDHMETERGALTGDVLIGTAAGAIITVTGAVRARPGDLFTNPTQEEGTEYEVIEVASVARGTALKLDPAPPAGELTLVPQLQALIPSRPLTLTWVHQPQQHLAPESAESSAQYTENWAQALKTSP